MRTLGFAVTTVVALAASTGALSQSQTDRAFTATGESCDQVTWSPESLAKYPRIASACQAVVERDGKYFVKFQGDVRRVADRGKEVTIDFKGGDRLTLTPPENLRVEINGRPTPVSGLRPGDQLNFYIPQDQLAANFFAGDARTASVPAEQVPIAPAREERVAAAEPSAPTSQPTQQASSQLPSTAGPLPWFGVAGLAFVMLGAVLTVHRRSSRRS